MLRPFLALFLAASLSFPILAQAEDENHAMKQLLNTTQTVGGQPITVPENPRLVISTLTIAPGQSLPIHKHPYARYAYLLNGSLDVSLVDSKKQLHFKKGDAFAEIIDGWHYGTNHGHVPVTLLIIDQLPQDVDSNTTIKQSEN